MSIFFRREFYSKTASLLLALAFLAESTLAPILLSLPQTVSAQTASSITISRSPTTLATNPYSSATNPYKAGDFTTLSSTNPSWIFAADYTGTGYNQIGTNAPRTFTFSTRQLAESGACNASTGQCNIPGNWDASSLTCPADVTGVQQMKEWYTAAGLTSNTLTWYFECSATNVPATRTPIGYLDGINTTGIAFGWALDPDSSATSISVHFYIDGAAGGGGTFAGSAVANISRPDLNAIGYPGNHGFDFSIPAQWRDGRQHALYVHGIDLSGDGSKNVLIGGVPKTFTLGSVQVSNSPVLSIAPTTITQGGSFTGSVTGAAPNTVIRIFAKGPDGVTAEDASGTTNSSGSFSRIYNTSGWTAGTYQGWVMVNGVQSNTVSYAVSLAVSGKLYIQPERIELNIGKSVEVRASLAPACPSGADCIQSLRDITNQAQWSSSNPAVVELGSPPGGIVNNVALGKSAGMATITATYQGHAAQAQVSVVSTGVNNPVQFLSATSIVQGGSFTGAVTGAAPNAVVRLFGKGPDGVTAEDAFGTTDSLGSFARTYITTGWVLGNYQSWASVNEVQSNIASFTITASTSTPPVTGRLAPTPTTAPMATLTLEREQEQVLPNQPISFKGTLDSTQVLFPQGSALFIAFPEKTRLEEIEIDGRGLSTALMISNAVGHTKIMFSSLGLYEGKHSFRIVLRNEVSSVPQLDRNIAVWVSVIDANNKLLLKGRTASTMVAHLPTEVIGKGVSLTVPRTITGWSSSGSCCWSSVGFPLLESGASTVPGSTYSIYDKKTYFPIREFSFGEADITRGPFFTPNQVPLLPENIAFTMLPGDASMQRIALSLKQFSDPLSREFITAQYQYILGRDPSSEEMARHIPKFTQWRNPLANLMEVYNRRSDVRQAVMVSRDRNIGGSNDGSPRSSWDKLLEWVANYGWKEEPLLASFKPQTGFDNGWQLFKELWEKYAPLVSLDSMDGEQWLARFEADTRGNPVAAIAYLCYTSNLNHKGSQQDRKTSIDFDFCWKNDPLVRHTAILWAKDSGWAYNHIFREHYADGEHGGGLMGVSLEPINPSGPILAQMFGPGKYPEFAQESAMHYPPAQLYYDLISSTEYASSIQQRFRTNIDSIYRLFFSRPATESDIAWVKNKFIGGIASYEFSDSKVFGFDRRWSWINEQWEPNGGLIASNFEYLEDEAFLKNSRFITDPVYGIRYIQGEIDAVSSRLVEMIERTGRAELYQGDNFKRIISGLYRLYLRRNPTDAEVETWRSSKKDFGKIEMDMNQSKEYAKDPAPEVAIKSLYRNYLGKDPSDAEIASWTGKSISTVANALGQLAEVRSYAQQHPENAYIFPIKHIKMVKCGFFCSIFKLRLTSLTMLIPGYGMIINTAINLGYGISGAVSGPQAAGKIMSIVLNSISRGFNEVGFNGKTFVQWVSIARSMAGQAGGVFSAMNLFENADPTILEGFRTMAVAPQTPQSNAFAQTIQQTYPGLASPFAAIAGLFAVKPEVSTGRIAQIDVSSHYGSGVVAKNSAVTVAKVQFAKTLKQGSRGAEVLKLQKLLGEMDLAFLPEYQTGYYGAKTVAAVKRFQKRNGLEQVGFIGAKTRALLNSIAR